MPRVTNNSLNFAFKNNSQNYASTLGSGLINMYNAITFSMLL